VNLVERALPQRDLRRFLTCLALAAFIPTVAVAADPIASSNFTGAESPLFENGAWVALTSMAPQGTRFQKNNGAFPDSAIGPGNNHAGARTTAAIPADHYSEIVVGHIANTNSYVGPFVRIQASGPAIDSGYMWWGSLAGGANNKLYRLEANGTSYHALGLVDHAPFADGDRLRLIARGPVIYGIRNGVREFIYNTGMDPINHPNPDGGRYPDGTAGMLAYVAPSSTGALTDATIASWSAGAAPVSSGTWASSNFAGTENPLDEGDRWYPLPGQAGNGRPYSGFRKAGGLAIGLDGAHNVSGVWSIAAPARQYSEVTLGTVASGGGGPVVRIDRTNVGQTGWLLFLWADNPSQSGIYKLNPDGSFSGPLATFTPTLLVGDKWRLTADGNTLTVSRNGVSQFTYTTDGSYPTGDVGIEAFTPAFTFMGWEGGDVNGPGPAIAGFTPTSGPVGTTVTISGTGFTGATSVAFNGTSASFTVTSATAIQATVPAGATTGRLSVTTPSGTATSSGAFTVVPPPAITSFAPTSGPVGTSVTISGTSFTGATSVAFNGTTASFTVASDTAIQTAVPAGATTGPLSVTTPGGTATSSGAFTVVPAPTIASFAPTSGPVGTSVTISGTNFTGATSVAFNGTSASFTLTSATAIQAAVPAGATTGPLSVTTPGGTATSSSAFKVVPPPTITSFAPTSGPVGTSVTISGTSFTGATAVAFNGVGATFTVASDTAIQAIVPAGATTGPVSVTTPGGTATSAGNFAVTAILTAAKAGAGNGSLTSTSSPASATQIDCGATCSASYDVGTVVTLTATAAAGSVQTGWTGCDTASGATCTVTMKAARTVTATFAVQTFTLSVRKSSLLLGNGTVTSSSSPASSSQINCGSTCSASYVSGTVVTLRAAPAFLSTFTGWSGCDTVSGTTCTVAMNRARSVTANFLP
jgi:hypothetical protein